MKNRKNLYLIFALVISPVLIHWALILMHTVNIPYADDYAICLDRLSLFFDASTFSEKIYVLFTTASGHQLALIHLLILFDHLILGPIDLRMLSIIGNLAFVGFALVLYKNYNPQHENIPKLLYFLPVTLILFQQQYYLSNFWGIVACSHFFTLFFGLSSLVMLNDGSHRKFLLAIVLAVLASMSFGNGMFIFIAGALLLLLQKRMLPLTIWSGIFVLVVSTYFYFYIAPAINSKIVENIPTIIPFFFSVIGSVADHSQTTGVITGILIFLFLIYMGFHSYHKKNLVLSCFIIFLLITVAAIAVSRASFGIEYAFKPKYKLYSTLFIAISYLFISEQFKLKNIKLAFPLIVLLATGFNVFSTSLNYPKIIDHKNKLGMGLLKWQRTGNSGLALWSQERAANFLNEAIKRGHYEIPDLSEFYNVQEKMTVISEGVGNIKFHIDRFEMVNIGLEIRGWAFMEGLDARGTRTYIYLRSGSLEYLFNTNAVKRTALAEKFGLNIGDAGFSSLLNTEHLPKGLYNVGIVLEQDGIRALRMTQKTLDIQY